MPRTPGEKFKCPQCGNVQPLNKAAHRSVVCVGCDTSFALVQDGEGGKALVPYFNQESANHSANA